MPILGITTQPPVNTLNAAYRPVIVGVSATGTGGEPVPPVVFCDIYINGTYYKTLTKTKETSLNLAAGVPISSNWEFDIQDAAQEYLRSDPQGYGSSLVASVDPYFIEVLCRMRSSGINASGFIVPEDTAPIQGTGSTPPTVGSGYVMDVFYAINATLQHEDNQNLETHLAAYRQIVWNPSYFPASHRGNGYKICVGDNDFFPIVRTGALGAAPINSKLFLYFKTKSQTGSAFQSQSVATVNVLSRALDIPAGPLNLGPLFPTVDFNEVGEYYVQLVAGAGSGTIRASSPIYSLSGCCEEDQVRIFFVNYLGRVDAVNFHIASITHKNQASTRQQRTTYPLVKSTHSIQRFNINSNEFYTAVATGYDESVLPWFRELFDSPKAWIAAKGTQGQPDYYLPVVLASGETVERKEDDRFLYDVNISFSLSHEKINLRN